MPYPKSHKEKSKLRILDAALELFSSHGFAKVSISQIMKSAKMTHGAFYTHFESKEALYSASFLQTLKGSQSARLVKAPLSVTHLIALVTSYWSLRELETKGQPGPEMILFNEIGNENTKVKTLFNASYDSLKKMLETRITALNRLKKLPFEPNREVVSEKARAVLALLVGAVTIAKVIPHEQERRKILEAAQKQILAMLGVNEAAHD
jgi:TetR/AcrR family transcriptional repressor of nem operon